MPGRTIVVWVVTAAAGALLWWLFSGTVDTAEVVVGSVAVILGTVAFALVRSSNLARFGPRLAWVLGSVRVVPDVLDGLRVLAVALWRAVRGLPSEAYLHNVRFDAGGRDPESAARRALVVMLTTLPPNFVIVDVDRVKGEMLVHQVKKSPVPAVAKMLGARE